jgi:hypothetical protein
LLVDQEGACFDSCSSANAHRVKFTENEMHKAFTRLKWKFINDKRVEEGCSARRPDFVFDLGAMVLIVENDENQHKSRPCECEQSRMIQIYQDYGGVPVHFIRFNPDKYLSPRGLGNEPLSKRLMSLCNVVRGIKKDKTFYTRFPHLSVSYMYYDGYDGEWTVDEINH